MMIFVYLAVGFCGGAVAMWVYLLKVGLFRTHGEVMLSQQIGDEQLNYFCEEAAKGFK